LDVYSQGKSENKTKGNLVEALSLFFLSCFERGTFYTILRECGFKTVSHGRKKVSAGKDYLDVPIPLQTNQPREAYLIYLGN